PTRRPLAVVVAEPLLGCAGGGRRRAPAPRSGPGRSPADPWRRRLSLLPTSGSGRDLGRPVRPSLTALRMYPTPRRRAGDVAPPPLPAMPAALVAVRPLGA